jgi:fatty acid desaturase
MSQLDPVPPPDQSPSAPPPPLPARSDRSDRSDRWQHRSGGYWVGAFLVIAGAYFLLANLGLLNWLNWDLVWPLVLILIGLYLVVRRLR